MTAKRQAIQRAQVAIYQALRVKARTPDALVFFRFGDFYELFESDAEVAAGILGLTIVERQGVKMAGVPYHAIDKYVAKLLEAGQRVAVVEEVK